MDSEKTTEQAASNERSWKIFFLTALVVGGALRLMLYLGTHWTIGDGLIGFRFGEQFAAGLGLVYNAGEKISCNTTLLYTFLLGLAAKAGLSLPLFARLLGIACDAITLFLMKQMVEASGCARSPMLRYGIPVIIYFFPLLAVYSVSAMETPIYVCLIFFLMSRTLKAQDWRYYLAAALVLLCRPDGVIPIAGSAAYITLRDWKIHWRLVVKLAVVGLGYAALNFAYYGTVVPYSLQAKAFFYHNTKYENFHFVAGRFFRSDAVFAVYLLTLLGSALSLRKNKVGLLLGVMSGFLFCFILLIAPGLRSYYVVPSLYVSLLTVALALANWIEKHLEKALKPMVICGSVAYAAVVFVGARFIYHQLGNAQIGQDDTVKTPGLWLRDNTPQDAKVFVTALEVGYYAKRYMLDSPGLATPRVLQALKAKPGLTIYDQADVVKADYVLIPETKEKAPPNFQLLRTFGSASQNSEYENITYVLYKRSEPEQQVGAK
jgi:hypothetical protein